MNLEYKTIAWWYWLASLVLLALGVFGWTEGFYYAIGVSAINLIHFVILDQKLTAPSVQVRAAFLAIMIIFLWEPIRFLYWIPVIGLSARVFFSYCFLARTLSLLPWNRKEPLSMDLIKRTYFLPPTQKSIF